MHQGLQWAFKERLLLTRWNFFRVSVSFVKSFRFQSSDFFLALLQKVTKKITMHYKGRKKKGTTNYNNHERWTVCCDQRSLRFWVGHFHVQLTGVDIYIKTRANVQQKKENIKCVKSYLRFYITKIEMVIGSNGREIKLLIGNLKGKVCIVYESYYRKFYFFLFFFTSSTNQQESPL